MLTLPFSLLTSPATTDLYTLSLHDALPISPWWPRVPIERMKTSGSRKWSVRRIRSPRSAPFENGLEGSTEITDRKSTRLNSSHEWISYAVFCLKKKKTKGDGRVTGADRRGG